MRQILTHDNLFLDLEQTNYKGSTILLQCLSKDEFDASCLHLLLDKRPNINARDIYGNNCLHVYFARSFSISGFNSSNPNISIEVDILVRLIRADADVYAINYFGRSISDMAYCNLNINPRPASIFKQVIWEAALSICGYDVAEFRKCYATNTGFEKWYTIKGYKKLNKKVYEKFYGPGANPFSDTEDEVLSDTSSDSPSDEEEVADSFDQSVDDRTSRSDFLGEQSSSRQPSPSGTIFTIDVDDEHDESFEDTVEPDDAIQSQNKSLPLLRWPDSDTFELQNNPWIDHELECGKCM